MLFLIVFAFFSLCAKGGNDHDLDICGLFYDINCADTIKDSSLYMQALCSASFLCLDYNSNRSYFEKGREAFNLLINRMGLNFEFGQTQLHQEGKDGGSDHEKVSHKGWEPYNAYDDATYGIWLRRKEILIETVNKVFAFSAIDEALSSRKLAIEKDYHPQRVGSDDVEWFDKIVLRMDSKSYSFATIIYYTHILGDIEENSDRTAKTRLSLYEVCTELTSHLQIVFGSRIKSSGIGKQLLEKLKNAQDAKIIMKYLQSAMQELIPKESFYKNSQLASQIQKAVGMESV